MFVYLLWYRSWIYVGILSFLVGLLLGAGVARVIGWCL